MLRFHLGDRWTEIVTPVPVSPSLWTDILLLVLGLVAVAVVLWWIAASH